MIDDATELPSRQDGPSLDERHADLVWWATWVGLILALVGLLDGLMMALTKKATPCPDGTFFSDGTTDFACYAHPQAGVGIAIAALSAVLGILVVFSSLVVRASLEAAHFRPDLGSTSSALRRPSD